MLWALLAAAALLAAILYAIYNGPPEWVGNPDDWD